jgi:hypothetical protein
MAKIAGIEGTSFAMAAGMMKIPPPIIVPMTIVVASSRRSFRGRSSGLLTDISLPSSSNLCDFVLYPSRIAPDQSPAAARTPVRPAG